MQRFTIPRDLFIGDNASEYLASVSAKRALIVYGSERLNKNGVIAKLEGYLADAGAEVRTFSGIEHDPSVATVMEGVKVMNEFQPDLIVGIGGGSPIDAAKSMWIFYEHPELSFADAAKPFSLPAMRNKAHFIAISTTSGTGSEVTCMSIITDEKTGIKYPVADFNITPDVAILDTLLINDMPKSLIANTGMDALTHAVEAYVSKMANPITDAVAMKAIEMIFDNLIDSYNGDQEARKNMHIAQNLAGMAFSNAVLGIAHSMAHKSGKLFNIPHGLANAVYLPHTVEFNAKTAPVKYADIAARLQLDGESDRELIASLVEAIEELRNCLEMPASLKEFGVDADDFNANLADMSAAAVGDPCTGTNPREISNEEMEQMYIASFNNTPVDF